MSIAIVSLFMFHHPCHYFRAFLRATVTFYHCSHRIASRLAAAPEKRQDFVWFMVNVIVLSQYSKEMVFLLEDAIRENLLASRLERFKAAAIDSLLIYVPTVILVSVFPKKEDIPGFAYAALGLYLLGLLLIQGGFLVARGQTIGKKLVNIQIVRSKDGQNGGFVNNVLLRTVVNGLITLIPLYLLVDILFIFSDTKRCLHDRIAGTIVVKKFASQE